MNCEYIAQNLKRLRCLAGLSQQALADEAGLSRSGYRKIENGQNRAPRVASLKALARVLEVGLNDLLAPVRPLEKVRFRSLKRLKNRDQVLAEVAAWLRDFSELEALTQAATSHCLAKLWKVARSPGGADIAALAAATRRVFGLNEEEPVHDICGLLEARGIKVRSVHVATDAFMGMCVGADEPGGPAVIVNTWPRLPVETWIFSAAHELAHLILHLSSFDVSERDEDEREEREANEFASHFLMPEAAFRSEWNDTAGLPLVDRVMKVKRVFRVSWRTVLFRVAQDLPAERRSTLWQRFNLEFRKRNNRSLLKHDEPEGVAAALYDSTFEYRSAGYEPAGLDGHDFREDRMALLVRRAVEQEKLSMSRAAEILRIPKREMRDLTASWAV